jgi:long-chain acyl-CoA synthetase
MEITAGELPLERVLHWERERPNDIFLTQPFNGGQVREWTFAQAVGEARRMAAYLKAQGWEPGSHVAILSKNCAWWIMADLAIWMAGHVSVPIYPSLRGQSIRHILEHSGAKLCFIGATDDRDAPQACRLPGIECVSFPNARDNEEIGWESLIEANVPLAGSPTRLANDVATIIYTSGTTGQPKGVMHRFGSFAYNARILADQLGLNGVQRVLSYLPLAHIVERAGVEALGCIYGWHLYFTEGLETFLTDLDRANPTLVLFVPRLLVKFQQGVFTRLPKEKLDKLRRIPGLNLYVKRRILRQLGLRSVRFAACGAAPLPVDVLMWYRNLGLPLLEGYGMTETMITHLPHPAKFRPGWIGPALGGVETRVTPEGELLVRSPMNMLGYYREPAMTAEAFTADGFFKTGDMVAVDSDGQTKIIGRMKEQFKTSKGKYVAPAPIENRLMEHPAVEACCIMGSGLPGPFAVVTLADAARQKCSDPAERQAMDESLAALVQSVNGSLDAFERLSMLVVVDGPWTVSNGLITPTLKIRRGTLEERYLRMIEEWRAQDSLIVWESIPAPAADDSYVARAAAEKSARHSEVPPSQT